MRWGGAVLRLEDLIIDNGGFRVAATLQVPKGARVAVMGPSGAGKSTLLGAVAGFHDTPRGRILWDGGDITALPPGKRPCAILFQDGNLFPHLSIAQNVGLGIDPGLRLNADQRARVTRALARVGLGGLDDRKPAQLSGGQQSRAALARVLVQDKPLLLLDEPFAALGPALKADMLELVAELAAETGATLMMVTHDPADARRIADQVIVVEDGVAHPPTATAALLDHPPEGLRAYLGRD